MMLFQHLHFMRPQWFYGLIPLGILLLLLLKRRTQTSQWQQVCDPHLLPHLLINQQQTRQLWQLIALACAWLFAIIALAGPAWSKLPEPVFRSNAAKVIVMDLSSQMLATDIPPSRLARSRYKILDLLNKYTVGQTGLVVFTQEPYVVSPLTEDNKTIVSMVPHLSPAMMPSDGNNIAAGLKMAVNLLQQANNQQGDILLLTANKATPADITLAKQLHDEGYKISVLGVGSDKNAPINSPQGGFLHDANGAIVMSKLDESSLQQLAQAGGGHYQRFTNNNDDLNTLISESNHEALQRQKRKHEVFTNRWQDQGHWFVLAILPFVLIGFRRGWLEEIVS